MGKIQGYYSSNRPSRSRKGDFYKKFFLFLIFSLAVHFVLPWWGTAMVCFVISWFTASDGGSAFFSALIAVFLIWLVHAILIDIRNNHILSKRIIALFPLPESSALLIFITGLIGGIAAGIAAMAGRQIGLLISKK
ncbi:MAG: hypothetical protein ACK4GL_01420 [Flavobacteriales bacterium]